jgi:hypothetical protein
MKNMDRDSMGHDNDTGIGQCTKVLRNTFGGKIQVIVPGAFGEANKELDPLVDRMAKLTAKTPLGQMLAPQNQSKWKICWKGATNALSPDTGSANGNSPGNSQCWDETHEIAKSLKKQWCYVANKEQKSRIKSSETQTPTVPPILLLGQLRPME